MWGLPLFAFVVVRRFSGRVPTVLEALVALAVVALAYRFPGRALLALVAVLPFQQLLLMALYRYGMPAALVRGLGGWKEAFAIGIFLAGMRGLRSGARRLDGLDALAFAYIFLATLYLIAPGVLATGPKIDFYVRLLAYRTDVMYVVLFIGVRHARIGRGFRDSVVRVALVAGIAAATIGIYELLFSDAWNRFVVVTLHYAQFTRAIFKVAPLNPFDIRYYGNVGGVQFVRIGGTALNPLDMGFYLVLVLGLGFGLVAANKARPWVYVGLGVVGVALIFTITRSAVLAGGVAAVLTFMPGPGRPTEQRARLAFILAAGLIIAAPLAGAANLTTRSQGAVSGTDPSAAAHSNSLGNSITSLSHNPLGQGLGTGPAVSAARFQVQQVVAENAYLQVGNEMGVFTMIVFVALLIAVLRRLRPRDRTGPPDALRGAAWQAGIALAIGGLFLHVWVNIAVAWIWWGAAGLALNTWSASDRDETAHAESALT
jgi:hypothetical protein